jgi:hypothetical protein
MWWFGRLVLIRAPSTLGAGISTKGSVWSTAVGWVVHVLVAGCPLDGIEQLYGLAWVAVRSGVEIGSSPSCRCRAGVRRRSGISNPENGRPCSSLTSNLGRTAATGERFATLSTLNRRRPCNRSVAGRRSAAVPPPTTPDDIAHDSVADVPHAELWLADVPLAGGPGLQSPGRPEWSGSAGDAAGGGGLSRRRLLPQRRFSLGAATLRGTWLGTARRFVRQPLVI